MYNHQLKRWNGVQYLQETKNIILLQNGLSTSYDMLAAAAKNICRLLAWVWLSLFPSLSKQDHWHESLVRDNLPRYLLKWRQSSKQEWEMTTKQLLIN